MADAPRAKLFVDVAQDRLSRERLVSIAEESAWDMAVSSNVYREPVYDSVIALPACLSEAWDSTGTGRYARLGIADFLQGGIALDADDWQEVYDKFSTDNYLICKNASGSVETDDSFLANVGIYFSWFSYGTGTEKAYPMIFGWKGNGTTTKIEVKCYYDGKLRIAKGGTDIAEYSFGSGTSRRNRNIPGAGGNQQRKFHELVIIPWRRRELLIMDGAGGHVAHVFNDLDEEEATPVITPAGKFFVGDFTGTAVKFQMAPVRYVSTAGYAVSSPSEWRRAPETGESWFVVEYADVYDTGTDVVGNVVEDVDYNTNFIADGVMKRFRVAVDVTATEFHTPHIYGMVADFDPVIDTIADENTELTDFIEEISLDVPETPNGVEVKVVLRNVEEVQAAIEATTGPSSYTFLGGGNRPMQFEIGPVAYVSGTATPPQTLFGLHAEVDTASFEIRDWYQRMEMYQFADPFPLDGRTFSNALTVIAESAGIPASRLNIETNTMVLEGIGTNWKYLIQAGDTALSWWNRLLDDIAGNWIHGVVPTATGPELLAGTPDYWGTTPEMTLYPTMAGAETALFTAGDFDEDAPWRHTYSEYDERVLEPEANEVWITGWDARAQRPFQVYKVDYPSQDPTLAVADRPSNWLGEIRKLGLVDPAITTLSVADRVCQSIFDRVTPTRRVAQWACQLPVNGDGVPLWRGRLVALDGRGTFRVNSMRLTVQSNRVGMPVYRKATFTGSAESTVMGRTAGVTLKQIIQEHALLLRSKTIIRGNAGYMLNTPILLANEL